MRAFACLFACVSACSLLVNVDDLGKSDASASMIERRTTSAVIYPFMGSPMTWTLKVPSTVQPGELLLATLCGGDSATSVTAIETPPVGWTLLDTRVISGNGIFSRYYRVAGATEPASYDWTYNIAYYGVAWLTNYANVDTTTPFELPPNETSLTGTSFDTPSSVSTTVPNSVALVTIYGYSTATNAQWTIPTGLVQIIAINNAHVRSAVSADALIATPGVVATYTLTSNPSEDEAIVSLVIMRPRT